jgi:hypothetical protein
VSKKSEKKADSASAGSVTVTIQDTLGAQQALAQLMRTPRPVLGGLHMRALARAMNAQLEDYEAERQALLERFAKKDKDGKQVTEPGPDGKLKVILADDAAQEAFNQAFQELLKAEWTCPVTIVPKDLGGLDVAPEVLLALGDFLDVSEAE